MQRLTRLLGSSDRGVTAVVVGILMVSLLGFTAIAVDVGSLWADKRELQNGADAGALAIAQDCAKAACGDTNAKATAYADANKNDGNASVPSVVVDNGAGTVTVTTSSLRQHWFAPILGIDSSTVNAKAVAAWGYPNGGSFLPLAFSICEFYWQTGETSGIPLDTTTERTVHLKTNTHGTLTGSTASDCGPNSGAAHNEVAGGFGWLSSTNCVSTSYGAGNVVISKPGGSVPSSCTAADFKKLQGATILVPLFDKFSGSGSNASYTIKGFAAYQITGYCFANQTDFYWPSSISNCPNDKRITGYFTKFVTLEEGMALSPTAVQFGIAVVKLTG